MISNPLILFCNFSFKFYFIKNFSNKYFRLKLLLDILPLILIRFIIYFISRFLIFIFDCLLIFKTDKNLIFNALRNPKLNMNTIIFPINK